VDYNAVDGEPVHSVFLVISPSIPVHLRILAQLGFKLRDPALRELLQRRAPDADILARFDALGGLGAEGPATQRPAR